MTLTMGRHSPPVNGTTLAPFTIPPSMAMPRGPVLPLRQPPPPWWRAIDGDTAIRVLAAAVVLAVAAFAAIVSYSHIFELGRQHGQDGVAARLLPLSVDGLIAAASLVMLHAARRSQPVPLLARGMLALGVAATIAANIFYGLPFGWLAAVVSAWPAVAFVGSVEMAVRFVRDARAVPAAAPVLPPPSPPPSPPVAAAPVPPRRKPVTAAPAKAAITAPQDPAPPAGGTLDRARGILAAEPGISGSELGRRLGLTVGQGRALMRQLKGAPQ